MCSAIFAVSNPLAAENVSAGNKGKGPCQIFRYSESTSLHWLSMGLKKNDPGSIIIISLMTPLIFISIMATRRRSVGVEISYQLAILVFLWKIFVSLIFLLFYQHVSSDPVLLSSPQGSGWQGRLLPASSDPASSWFVTRTVTTGSLSPCTWVTICHKRQSIYWEKLSGQGLTWSVNLWHLRKVKVYCGWLRRWPA